MKIYHSLFLSNLFWFCLVLPSFYLFASISFLSFFFFLFTMHFLIIFLLYSAFFSFS